MRAAVELSEPVYYDPVSSLDDAAVVLTSAAGGALSVAFYSWWRTAPFPRLSIILLVAAIGIAAESVGNLLEDGFDSEFGATLYDNGGLVGAVALIVTAAGFLGLGLWMLRRPARERVTDGVVRKTGLGGVATFVV